MMGLPRLLLLPCLLMAIQSSAAGGDFRCGADLIREGDIRSRVRSKCGPPTEITRGTTFREPIVWRHGRPIRVAGGLLEIAVETWTYNLGPSSFMRRLRFEDGELVNIETLGYGYHPR
jgi:hypothetical protein